MKKLYILLVMILILFSFSFAIAGDFTIVVSPQKVIVNNVQMDFEVYNINGNNFFKLRDIAYVLNSTKSQFAVDYNESNNLIEIEKGKEYISNGSEMRKGTDNSSTAVLSSQKVSINGKEVELIAYNIAGNNFFKLRDLGSNLDFIVDYDGKANSVIVNSKSNSIIANVTSVKAKESHGIEYVEILSDYPINSFNVFSMFDTDNKRIVLDLPDTNIKSIDNTIVVNDGNITTIRIGDQGNDLFRVVLDVVNSCKYKVVQSEDKKITCIALSEEFNINMINDDDPINEVESGENIVVLPEDEDTEQPKYSEEELKNRIKITSVKYSSTYDTIKISGSKKFEYNTYFMNKEYGIMCDIDNAVLSVEGLTSISPKNKNITEITMEQLDEMTVRIIVNMKNDFEYEESMKNNILTLTITEPNTQSLTYKSSDEKAEIILKDVEEKVFSITENEDSNKYTLKYSESRFSCDHDTMDIDDEWVDSIKITTGKIVIIGKGMTQFAINQQDDDVIITVSKDEYNVTDNGSNTVSRTSKFTVKQISSTKVQVGKVNINNKSGLELDLTELSKKSNVAIDSSTDVLIYHTHTTEGYIESGASTNFRTTDHALSVVFAGSKLTKYLQSMGINVLHDTTRNDTNFNYSYDTSLNTVQKILARRSFDITIDLHRDAISSDLYFAPTADINGKKAARLMFVMGSDAYGLEHPNWMENLKLAILIQNKAEEMYPGLFRDMSLVQYRYNQHLTKGSMLIEVGATGNTLEQVNTSMNLLANVFAALDK